MEKKPLTLEKFIAIAFMVALSIASSIAVNIYGWGLHPRSWGWILGVGFGWSTLANVLLRKLLD